MKEILSSQFDAVSGGWNDRDGSGKRSSDNPGSGGNRGGNSGSDRGFQTAAYKLSNEGSGSGAYGFGNAGSYSSKDYGNRRVGTDR
ncbi:hypothetical protein ACOTR2_00170 (plasmid) [Enterobacter asburiae]|nr:hypothetical protein [Enterobacter sp. 18A13]